MPGAELGAGEVLGTVSRALLRQSCSRTSNPCLVGVVKMTPRSWRGLDGRPMKVRPEQTFPDGRTRASGRTAVPWLPTVCLQEFVILLLRPTPQSASRESQPAFPSGNARVPPPPRSVLWGECPPSLLSALTWSLR